MYRSIHTPKITVLVFDKSSFWYKNKWFVLLLCYGQHAKMFFHPFTSMRKMMYYFRLHKRPRCCSNACWLLWNVTDLCKRLRWCFCSFYNKHNNVLQNSGAENLLICLCLPKLLSNLQWYVVSKSELFSFF